MIFERFYYYFFFQWFSVFLMFSIWMLWRSHLQKEIPSFQKQQLAGAGTPVDHGKASLMKEAGGGGGAWGCRDGCKTWIGPKGGVSVAFLLLGLKTPKFGKVEGSILSKAWPLKTRSFGRSLKIFTNQIKSIVHKNLSWSNSQFMKTKQTSCQTFAEALLKQRTHRPTTGRIAWLEWLDGRWEVGGDFCHVFVCFCLFVLQGFLPDCLWWMVRFCSSDCLFSLQTKRFQEVVLHLCESEVDPMVRQQVGLALNVCVSSLSSLDDNFFEVRCFHPLNLPFYSWLVHISLVLHFVSPSLCRRANIRGDFAPFGRGFKMAWLGQAGKVLASIPWLRDYMSEAFFFFSEEVCRLSIGSCHAPAMLSMCGFLPFFTAESRWTDPRRLHRWPGRVFWT